jgi:hypothetical protein
LFQLRYGFQVPFPLNIALLPLSITEGLINWMVVAAPASVVAAGAAAV